MLPSHVSGSIRQGGLQVFLFRRKKSTLNPIQLNLFFSFSLGLLPICALAMGLLVFLKPETKSSAELLWSRHSSYIKGGIYPSLA